MPTENNYLSFASPQISSEDIKAVTASLSMGHLSFGPEVEDFQNALQDWFSPLPRETSVLAMSSGTAALHAIFLSALSQNFLSKGDEVLIPALTFAAPINMALATGLKVKLVDISAETLMPTLTHYQEALTPKTKAIVVVHLYGHAAPIAEIGQWARQNKLLLIEDAAESFGAQAYDFENQRWKHVGTFGDMSAFSFQATKALSLGEGGAVYCADKKYKQTLELIRSHGMGEEKYLHHLIGFNFRMTSYQAALGCSKLKYFSHLIEKRRKTWLDLTTLFSQADLSVTFPKVGQKSKSVPWGFPIVFNSATECEKLKALSTQYKIEVRPFFRPIHRMPAYQSYGINSCPIAENLSRRGVVLPLKEELSLEEKRRLLNLVAHSLQNRLPQPSPTI